MPKRLISRKTRSVLYANVIYQYGFFDEWRIFSWSHPKVKSKYRLATLFLLHKKHLYKPVQQVDWTLNCDNLIDRYYED